MYLQYDVLLCISIYLVTKVICIYRVLMSYAQWYCFVHVVFITEYVIIDHNSKNRIPPTRLLSRVGLVTVIAVCQYYQGQLPVILDVQVHFCYSAQYMKLGIMLYVVVPEAAWQVWQMLCCSHHTNQILLPVLVAVCRHC